VSRWVKKGEKPKQLQAEKKREQVENMNSSKGNLLKDENGKSEAAHRINYLA